MIPIEASLALLSFSAPVTVAIMKLVPKRAASARSNGHVSTVDCNKMMEKLKESVEKITIFAESSKGVYASIDKRLERIEDKLMG